jgi:hypothetical protein
MAKKLPMNYALQPRDVDIVAALADGFLQTADLRGPRHRASSSVQRMSQRRAWCQAWKI